MVMSGMVSADQILEQRGVSQALDAFVVAAVFDRDGGACAFALGDGSLWRVPVGGDWEHGGVHDGAVLSLSPAASPRGWISGGDDGLFARVAPDGAVSEIARFGMRWVEQTA